MPIKMTLLWKFSSTLYTQVYLISSCTDLICWFRFFFLTNWLSHWLQLNPIITIKTLKQALNPLWTIMRMLWENQHEDNKNETVRWLNILYSECDYICKNKKFLKEFKHSIHLQLNFPCTDCDFQSSSKTNLRTCI
mgnify:CR=1 FL=1